jgi:hypothetical protein
MDRAPNLNRDDHRDLFRVTNEIHKLRHNPSELTNGDYRNILVELCSVLNSSFEKGLDTAIRSMNIDSSEVRQQAKAIVDDFGRFSEVLIFTRDKLLACGIEKDTADEIIQYVSALQTEIKRAEFQPEAAA